MEADKSTVAFDLLQEVKALFRSQAHLFLIIGGTLKKFRDEKLYKDLGYETWVAFLSGGELSQKTSTIQAYIQIYEIFIVLFNVPMPILEEIPYDKLRLALPEVIKAKSREAVDEWISKARSLSRSDILKERGLMTESGKPIGWRKTVILESCDKCGKWKMPADLIICTCRE
jgi:hypothetical protein